jgi:hypothetical protein
MKLDRREERNTFRFQNLTQKIVATPFTTIKLNNNMFGGIKKTRGKEKTYCLLYLAIAPVSAHSGALGTSFPPCKKRDARMKRGDISSSQQDTRNWFREEPV